MQCNSILNNNRRIILLLIYILPIVQLLLLSVSLFYNNIFLLLIDKLATRHATWHLIVGNWLLSILDVINFYHCSMCLHGAYEFITTSKVCIIYYNLLSLYRAYFFYWFILFVRVLCKPLNHGHWTLYDKIRRTNIISYVL